MGFPVASMERKNVKWTHLFRLKSVSKHKKVTDLGSMCVTFCIWTHFSSKKVCPFDFSRPMEATGNSTKPFYLLSQIAFLRFPGKLVFVPRVRALSVFLYYAKIAILESPRTRGTKIHFPGNRRNAIWDSK